MNINYSNIIEFWFEECSPKDWFQKNDAFDQMLKDRFASIHQAATAGDLFIWRDCPEGRLAEILILDQFSRNMFRDSAQSFAYDGMALVLAQEMVARGDDQKLIQVQRTFTYMPYMHSESRIVHEEGMRLFADNGEETNLRYMKAHKDIIDQFGRYPHRNEILGRTSTEAEIEFMKNHGGF